MNTPTPTKKIASLELGRLIAIFAVVAMHCQLFMTYLQVGETPWLGYLFNQCTRFAVPLFFLIAGFLIQPKLVAAPMVTLKNYCAPLLRIFAVWSVICLLMPFDFGTLLENGYLAERLGYWQYLLSRPINTLLEGGLVHLWFLPALMLAALITALLLHFHKARWLLPIAVVLYLYGVAAGSYYNLTNIWAFCFTRNGPFFSTLMFALGFLIREKEFRLSRGAALAMALIGMAMHLGEAYFLMDFKQPFNSNDYLLGTVLWGTGLFLFLLATPQLGDRPWVFHWRNMYCPSMWRIYPS